MNYLVPLLFTNAIPLLSTDAKVRCMDKIPPKRIHYWGRLGRKRPIWLIVLGLDLINKGPEAVICRQTLILLSGRVK